MTTHVEWYVLEKKSSTWFWPISLDLNLFARSIIIFFNFAFFFYFNSSHIGKWRIMDEVPIFVSPQTYYCPQWLHLAFSLPSIIPILVKWSQTLDVVILGLLLALSLLFLVSYGIEYMPSCNSQQFHIPFYYHIVQNLQ